MRGIGADEDLLPPYLPLGLYRVTFIGFTHPKKTPILAGGKSY